MKRRALRFLAPQLGPSAFEGLDGWQSTDLTPTPEGCAHSRTTELISNPRQVQRCLDCQVAFATGDDPFDDSQTEFWDEKNLRAIYRMERGRIGSLWDFLSCRTVMMHGAQFQSLEPPNRRALDVGAGCGYFLHWLKGYFQFETWGLEPSEWGRRYARETFGLENITPETTPTEAKMDDDFFGLLILVQTLEHVPQPLELLKDIHRVGVPGAVFYGEVPDSDYLKDWHFPEHRWFFNEPSLDYHLRCAGFEVLKIFPGRALPWPEAVPFLSWLARKPV